MNTNLEQSYQYCAGVARKHARNFFYGFLMLPPQKRSSMHAIYAFMRLCDDIADDAPLDGRADRLRQFRSALDSALDGRAVESPVFPAFRDALERHGIPRRHFHELIDGAEMDLRLDRYPTFDSLRDYCYHVAGVVGLVCLHVFGFQDERAPQLSEECGLAFQLTNILRDVREDADRGRIYLPQEDLRRFEVAEGQVLAGEVSGCFREMMRFQVDRARGYYRRARTLIPLVSPDSRACLAAMIGIYEGVLDRVELQGYDVFARRPRLSGPQKAGVVLRSWLRHRGGREGT